MEYRHSQVVDPSLYDNDGLFEGIALRVHHNTELEDRGCLRARRDWQQLHDSVPSTYTGVMGPEYSFVSTWFPETLPDRFELMAYMHEMAFLFDDIIDDAEDPTVFAMAYMADFLQVHRLVMGSGDLDKMELISHTPITTIFADVTKAMVAVDAERTRTVFHWVEKWGLAFINRPTHKDFRDFDHYLEYRFANFASE
jgi:fusicocca-2,10(14)-diene synthase/ophiobolin F synthase